MEYSSYSIYSRCYIPRLLDLFYTWTVKLKFTEIGLTLCGSASNLTGHQMMT